MKKFSYQGRIPYRGEIFGTVEAYNCESAAEKVRKMHPRHRISNLRIEEITK